MWWPIHAINLNLLLVKGRSDLFLRLEIIKKVWGVFILACTLPFGLIIFCLGQILSSLVSLIINTYYTGKLINCGYFKQMHDLAPALLLSLLTFTVAISMTFFFDSLWLQLIVGGLCGAATFLGLALLFKMEELQDVKYMLKMKQ